MTAADRTRPAEPYDPPRRTSELIRRAMAALADWVAREPPNYSIVEFYDRLLPWERIGDLDDHRGCMTALALSPGCSPDEATPQTALDFIANYASAHPERDFDARFPRRTAAEVHSGLRAREEMTKTLRVLWPEFEGWDVPLLRHHVDDYRYDVLGDCYWYLPLLRAHSARATNADIGFSGWPVRLGSGNPPVPVPPAQWLANRDNGHVVDCVAWLPGEPPMVRGVVIDKHGRGYYPGANTLNIWRPGPAVQRDAPDAKPWRYLIRRLFPNRVEREEVLNRLAWIVQNPGKPVMGVMAFVGPQGVGKDAMLLPINYALGWHNVKNVTPDDIVNTFNPWLQSSLVILNEIRLDPREGGGHELYSKLKSYSTTPPDIVMINDKFDKLRAHLKTASFIATSNDLAGFHLPPDERRFFMPEITLRPRWHIDEGRPELFVDYFRWLRWARGYAAVHKYLAGRDLRHYDPARAPILTRTKQQAQEITTGGDDPVSRAINTLGRPAIFFEIELHDLANGQGDMWSVSDRDLQAALRLKARVQQIEDAGYVRFPHPAGLRWVVNLKHTFEAAPGQPPRAEHWRKESKAAYVRRSVWDTRDDDLVFKHLMARLRRLALRGPGEPGGTVDGVSEWSDPRGIAEPTLPPLPGSEPDDAPTEETSDEGAAAQRAGELEVRAREMLRRARELRRQAGELDLPEDEPSE